MAIRRFRYRDVVNTISQTSTEDEGMHLFFYVESDTDSHTLWIAIRTLQIVSTFHAEIRQNASSESIKIELVTELVTLFRALSVYDIFIQELVHEFGRIVMIAFFIRRLFNYAIHTNDT